MSRYNKGRNVYKSYEDIEERKDQIGCLISVLAVLVSIALVWFLSGLNVKAKTEAQSQEQAMVSMRVGANNAIWNNGYHSKDHGRWVYRDIKRMDYTPGYVEVTVYECEKCKQVVLKVNKSGDYLYDIRDLGDRY